MFKLLSKSSLIQKSTIPEKSSSLFFTDTKALAKLLKAIHEKSGPVNRMMHLNAEKKVLRLSIRPLRAAQPCKPTSTSAKQLAKPLCSSTPQRCIPTGRGNWQELPCIKQHGGAPAPERHEGMTAPLTSSFRLCGLSAEKLLACGLGASEDSAAIIFLPVVVYLLTI